MDSLITKNDLLKELRLYAETPDDDVIRIKKEIERKFMGCPKLLYALHEKELENELFDKNGNINWDIKTHEPLGEWDRYFGTNANIRPFLFIPDTQTEVRHYICYQVNTDENVSHNYNEKKLEVIFNIFVHGNDRVDKLTGVPRHDLIASIIRENFAWIGLEIPTTIPIYNRESITDNNYLTRIVKYECILPNDMAKTTDGSSVYINKRW